LTGPEACAQVNDWLHRNQHREVRDRLRALQLAFTGDYTHARISQMVGRSVSTVQRWFAWYREGGLEAVLGHRIGQSGGAPETLNSDEIRTFLKEGLESGRWRTIQQARQALEARQGRSYHYQTVRRWVKKSGGTMRVPRPTHRQRDPEKAEAFKQDFFDKLMNINLQGDLPVKVWFADEARFGLLPIIRKCWTLKGLRPVAPYATKYEWSYVYGAIDVVEGELVCSQTSTTDLPTTEAFLQEICKEFPRHEHIVVWDGAGFHHREGHCDIPERVHPITLPPYSPDLNPIEKLWDLIQDQICNRLFDSVEKLEAEVASHLEGWWTNAKRVLSLVGQGWQHHQANSSSPTNIPIN